LPGDAPFAKSNTEIAPHILGLSDPSAEKRADAAAAIFHHGRELARVATQSWLANEALSELFVEDESGFPQTTVGVAVEPVTFESIRHACGSPVLADVPPDQDAREFELEFPKDIRLDILTTRDRSGSGAIARHLQRFGESVQQVELVVKSVDRATEILTSQSSVVPVYPQTRPGANGTRINFFLVLAGNSRKVLIELVEPRSPL
jgi:hypothetical protein